MNRWKIGFLILVLFAVAASLYGAALIRRGFSAREKPSTFEETVARAARNMARPSTAKNEKNPFPPTQDILEEARRHFADHCATCHANDGSGQTEIGDHGAGEQSTDHFSVCDRGLQRYNVRASRLEA